MTPSVLIPERPVRPEVNAGLDFFIGLGVAAVLGAALWAVIILVIWRLTT